MIRRTRSFIVILILATAVADVAAAQTSLGIDSVIAWLPLNTETLIVAHGPIAIADTSAEPPFRVGLALAKMAATGALPPALNGTLQRLRDTRVRFAVEGARNFRAPSGLGLGPYDGCHITVFDYADVEKIDAFIHDLQVASEGSTNVAGHTALRLHWRAEHNDWSVLVVRPRPSVIIFSTSEPMLAEVLERVIAGASDRAFPPGLEEWSRVDTTARVWALRHYARVSNAHDPTSPVTAQGRAGNAPDSLAVGTTISIATDSSGIIANYLSPSPQAVDVARRIWRQASDSIAPLVSPDGRDVRIAIPSPRPETRPMLLLVVFVVLGHAIFI